MNQWLRFNRWEAKTNRTLYSYSWFFPLLRKWQVIARNSDWFVTLFAPVVIGRSVYLVVGFRQWVSEWVSVTIEPSIGTLQIFGPMFPDLWNFLWVDIFLPFYFPPGDPIDISYAAHIICDPRAAISRWLVKTSWRKAPMKYIICLHTARMCLRNKMAAAGVEEEDTELNLENFMCELSAHLHRQNQREKPNGKWKGWTCWI